MEAGVMSRILVAGETGTFSPACRVLLESKNYQPVLTAKLSEALSLVLEDPPDHLLVQYNFPDDGARQLIRAVNACLHKANIPIILLLHEHEVKNIDWTEYPVDDFLLLPFLPEQLLRRIQLAESRLIRVFDNNPLSRLPGNTSILKAVQRAIDSGKAMGVCYVDIDNFKPYNDRYGFARGDEVILMVARLLVNVIGDVARASSFVGHIGGDDFVFLVPQDKVAAACEQVLANFEAVRNIFLSAEDIAVGAFVGKDRLGRETRFGLLSLSIAAVITGKNRFVHYGEVAAAASQVKHYVKKIEGSNYKIDERDGYVPADF